MSVTDEEYWRKSSLGGFNFDDDAYDESSGNLLPSDSTSETVFYTSLQNNIVLPINSIISKRGLDIILQDTRLPVESSVHSTEETIKKLFLGIPCLLDNYRSLEQKVELLENAVKTADGNVILKVILYLEKTLKRSLLYYYLSKYKLALSQYCNYLIQENKYQELNVLYMSFGSNNDMSNLFYLSCQNYVSRKRIHSEIEKFFNESGNVISDYNKLLLHNYKTFVGWQKGDAAIKSVTEVLTLLYKEHFINNVSQQDITAFSNLMKLSSSQHDWIMLNTMAAHQMWEPLIDAFVKPSLFKKKIKSSVNIDSIMNALYKHNAPKKVSEQFLLCVSDSEKCLQLGKKMQCHAFVVNKLIENRDRLGLIEYRKYIPSQSEEYFNLEKNLCSDKKWKN